MRAASKARTLLFVRRQSQITAPLPGSSRVPVPKQIGQTSSPDFSLACDLGASRFLAMLTTFVSGLSDDIQEMHSTQFYNLRQTNRSFAASNYSIACLCSDEATRSSVLIYNRSL